MNYLISFLLIGVICVPLLMTLTNIIYVFQDCEKVKERWGDCSFEESMGILYEYSINSIPYILIGWLIILVLYLLMSTIYIAFY